MKLKIFDIVLGVLYMIAFAIELFGFFAALKVRTPAGNIAFHC